MSAPSVEFNRIIATDPETLRLDPDELRGLRKRQGREASDLVERMVDVQIDGLIQQAMVEVPEFRFLGPHHNVLSCSLLHVQEHGCGLHVPTELACADARAIVDLLASALQLEMGAVARVLMRAVELSPAIEGLEVELADTFRAENSKPSFSLSRAACDFGGKLYNKLAELDALLREARRDWLFAPYDALDKEKRPSLSRAEGAFWPLGLEPSDIRKRIVDQRGGANKPNNNVRGRYKPDRPILEIRSRT